MIIAGDSPKEHTMVEATVQFVYGFNFDESLFANELAEAAAAQNPNRCGFNRGEHLSVLTKAVARRLEVQPGEFQLLGGFDVPLVLGYSLAGGDHVWGQKGEARDERYEHLLIPLPKMAEDDPRREFLARMVARLYPGRDDISLELKVIIWHPY